MTYNNVMTPDEKRTYNREKSARWREANRAKYNAYMREQKRSHPLTEEQKARQADRQREWVEKNRQHHADYMRTYYRKHRDKIILEIRERTYGVTAADQLALLEAQGNVCAICHQPERGLSGHGFTRSLHLDHNHATGAMRGFLCGNCNRMLGAAIDNPAILRAAADYLER